MTVGGWSRLLGRVSPGLDFPLRRSTMEFLVWRRVASDGGTSASDLFCTDGFISSVFPAEWHGGA